MAESATKSRTVQFKTSRQPSHRLTGNMQTARMELQAIDHVLTSPPLPQNPLRLNAVHAERPSSRSRGHSRNITAPAIGSSSLPSQKTARSASETRSPRTTRPMNEILMTCPTVSRHLEGLNTTQTSSIKRPVQHSRTTTAPTFSRPLPLSPNLTASGQRVVSNSPKSSSESIGLALGSPSHATFPRKLSLPIETGIAADELPRKSSLPEHSEDWADRVASVWPTPGLATALKSYEAVVEANPRPKPKKWKSFGSFLKRNNSSTTSTTPNGTQIFIVPEAAPTATSPSMSPSPSMAFQRLNEEVENISMGHQPTPNFAAWASPISPKQRWAEEHQNNPRPENSTRPVGLGLRAQTAPANHLPTLADGDEDDMMSPPPPPKDERYLPKKTNTKPSVSEPKESSHDTASLPNLSRAQSPRLNIEIPQSQMDRYSIMFGSLLDPEIVNSPRVAPLLKRRQINVEKLAPLNESPVDQEKGDIIRPQRPLSSPSPATPHFPFVAFPPKPADDPSSPVSPKQTRPWQLGRTQTAPGSIPQAQDLWRRRKGFVGLEGLGLLSPPSETPFSEPHSAFSPTTVASSDDGNEFESNDDEIESSTPLSQHDTPLKPQLDLIPSVDMIQKEILGMDPEDDDTSRDRKDSVMSDQNQSNRNTPALRPQKQFFMPMMSEGNIASRSMCSPTALDVKGRKGSLVTAALV